ncbi:uncharacterized protein AC631_00141 [Debaryomyces fabryi]|uniref:Vacuolar protein sorting-associated protein 17 n=1 Tax=Debaryomyces fabryi TaxID=58627 RepID=A0A0V1Q6C4_9ASCO|nr:uncharacterized protein AC631_00141 [Debaryomyces fabryi]KSA04062.1 hypothetical protein AC631_00141 [Debaryomyces fabryi]CUM50233.1 unnamed protein product [Debaryomyces fabryi]
MASAEPFNPDDFENNNPFSSPNHDDHINRVEEPAYEEEPTNEEITSEQQENSKQDVQGYDQLSEEELHKLLPERFTNKYQINIKLTAIEKNKAGNPILRFDSTVRGLPKFRSQKYKDVRRTYNEIVKFNKYLTVSNLEVFVPVIPLAITSYPANGEDETKQLHSVWQEWFNRITSNPILIRDEEFVYFIENDFGYSVINSSRKSSVASGLVRKTLKQLAIPYDPYEELAEFRPLIKSSYLICQKLHKLLDRNSKAEKQLSLHINELATKLVNLSEFEIIHPGMKNMWEKLSRVTTIQSDLTLIQLINDMGTLGDGIQTLVNDFYEIKEALTNRHLIMRELLQAETQTKAKHYQATKIKNKSALDPIKVDEAIRSLEYATKTEESLNLQIKRISGEMLFEKEEVLNHVDQKFQKMFKAYTLNRVDQHRKILKHLEHIRLDIRIIDEKGGLSRLNRDNLSNLKHNLTQSQSNNGDSWSSRTFRSLKNDREAQKEASKNQDNVNDNNIVDAKHAASILGVATF